jgi:hypothetical protein
MVFMAREGVTSPLPPPARANHLSQMAWPCFLSTPGHDSDREIIHAYMRDRADSSIGTSTICTVLSEASYSRRHHRQEPAIDSRPGLFVAQEGPLLAF